MVRPCISGGARPPQLVTLAEPREPPNRLAGEHIDLSQISTVNNGYSRSIGAHHIGMTPTDSNGKAAAYMGASMSMSDHAEYFAQRRDESLRLAEEASDASIAHVYREFAKTYAGVVDEASSKPPRPGYRRARSTLTVSRSARF